MGILEFLPIIGKVIDRVLPDKAAAAEAHLKVAELAQRGELAELDADVKLAVGQMEINKQEAASVSVFVSGWRPAVGWVCVAAIGYQLVARPIGWWIADLIITATIPTPPVLDLSDVFMLLGGMLGLGTLRTVEKIKGVAAK